MRQNLWLPMLVVVLGLAWPPIEQTQQSNAAMAADNSAEDLGRLRDKSQNGDAAAQYELGEKYRIGFAVEQDHSEAIELYDRSASQGYAPSLFRLGELYKKGDILERDLGKAIASYRKAAEQGHSGAQFALAESYYLGSGVAQDMAAAMVWYRRAAEQGDEWSQLALGDQYLIGVAVPKDLVQATKWYRQAAERGNIFAQYEMGDAYRYGGGVSKNITQAMEWYRRSAEAGHPTAKRALTELRADIAAAESVTALAPEPEVPRDPSPQEPTRVSEADLAPSEVITASSETDQTKMRLPERGRTTQVASSSPQSLPAEPSYGDENAVSRLLEHAQKQVARLALTTPKGDNAFETYQQILSLQPNDEAALAGIEQIGVKYVELAGLAVAKGELRKASYYAAKATQLAPDHPTTQALAIPPEAPPVGEEETRTVETLPKSKAIQQTTIEMHEIADDSEASSAFALAVDKIGSPMILDEPIAAIGFAPSQDEALSQDLDLDFVDGDSLVVTIHPGEVLFRTKAHSDRNRSRDHDVASAGANSSGGGGSNGGSGSGGSGSGGSGSGGSGSGDAGGGDAGGGDAGGGDSGDGGSGSGSSGDGGGNGNGKGNGKGNDKGNGKGNGKGGSKN